MEVLIEGLIEVFGEILLEIIAANNLYVGGDGAGITRGLAQAGANGVKIAREIINKLNSK